MEACPPQRIGEKNVRVEEITPNPEI